MDKQRDAVASDIDSAVALLRAGEVVAFPTETVYGLGADARNPRALSKIFALKGRPTDHPLILHLASVDELPQWVAEVPRAAVLLAEHFWPGPLTLVLPRAATVPRELTGGQDSVAVRVPRHPVARALLRAFGGGVAAPSANRYGRISPTSAAHVREEFPQGVQILEGDDCEVGLESTILSLLESPPRLLRPGVIGQSELEAVIGPVVSGTQADTPRVPGSMAQHYAPLTPVALVRAADLPALIEAYNSRGEAVAVLARTPPVTTTLAACAAAPAYVRYWVAAPPTAAAYGHDLYANLRLLDKQGAARILIEEVPDSAEWDAVRDRLTRAAAR